VGKIKRDGDEGREIYMRKRLKKMNGLMTRLRRRKTKAKDQRI